MINHMCIHAVVCAELQDRCPKLCRAVQYGGDITSIRKYFEDHKGLILLYNASVIFGDLNYFEVIL